MALDLFANFERSSNSSLFYRVTSTSSTFTVKLSDLSLPGQDLGTLYYAQSSLNDGPFSEFVADINGIFSSSLTFDTSSPCVCSISVNVSSIEGVPYNSFSLSGIFVDRFPIVDFIAYPSNYIIEATKQIGTLTEANYQDSPGVYFYGEGHTEYINLSAGGLDVGDVATWFIGTPINDISQGISILSAEEITSYTSIVSVSSAPADTSSYPISLFVTNSNITTAGPFVTYEDLSGSPQFYSFFTSSLDVSGIEHRQPTKGNIRVLPYPASSVPSFQSPFASSVFSLPLDYSLQTFRGIITNSSLTSILTENFVGSKWELQAVSDNGDWSISTDILSHVLAYQFQLSYDKNASNVYLPNFTASTIGNTTVSVLVSSFKDITIDLAPYDWLPRRVYTEHSDDSDVSPIPFAKLYIPNYFNLRNQDVPITVVGTPNPPLEIVTFTVQSPHSSDVLILSGSSLSGTMQFNKIGVTSLSATALLRSTVTGTDQLIIVDLPNMLEVVTRYDDEPNEKYFQTELTPIELSYTSQPRLTPNEWAIADNVNSIIDKIYTTIDDLDRYTKLYQKKDKFYGWIGPKSKTSEITNSNQVSYVWVDLECPVPASENTARWTQFECIYPDSSKTWQYNECDANQSDPSCLQKYCIEWKWKSRKYGANAVNVPWKSTKSNAEYAKKWLFEKCEVDAEPLNCDRDSWKISTTDTHSFPIPSCTFISRCAIVDAEVNEQSDQIVIAYPTEINLIDKDYFTTYVARRGGADELFSFQNIVGITLNSEGKVIVLDNVLPRISVFKIVDGSFNLFSTWGGYGLASSPQGFNKPQDVHVDSSNSVWIADTGNNCIKKLTIIGNPLLTITHTTLDSSPPLSVCVDSRSNVHCLIENGVIVFDQHGNYLFKYTFPKDVIGVKKINTSYNREMVYITYTSGIIKYFRTGVISHYTIQDMTCADGLILQNYNSLSQDKFRNVYVTVGDKILKLPDLQKVVELKAAIPPDLYWSLQDLLIHKEEYIQPWVYLKSFHRLWDNIELLRNSLFYNLSGCKSYVKPEYMKTDLIIGQNEIVSNAVINRLAEQLWTNLLGLIDYFDPNCEK